MELSLVRSSRDVDLPVPQLTLLGLIILGHAFSDVSIADPDHRVIGRVVVRGAPKNLDSDHTLPKRLVRTRKAMFDDVAKKVLALSAGAKRNNPKDVLQNHFNLRPSTSRNGFKQ